MSKNNSEKRMNIKSGIRLWLFSKESNNFTKLLIAIIPAVIAYFSSVQTSTKIINNQSQSNNQICAVDNKMVNQDNAVPLNTATTEVNKINQIETNFDKEKWNFYKKDFIADENGFYCPGFPGFPNWAVWSKTKLKANQEITIVFSLLDKTNNSKNPTLFFSYGDKTNKKPEEYYTINILDGDLNTIRLYPRKGSEIFARSSGEIQTDNYITFNISPVFTGKNSSKLIINPSVTYLFDGIKETFVPKHDFSVELPFMEESQGSGFNIGLGVSKGDCFKIISTNI